MNGPKWTWRNEPRKLVIALVVVAVVMALLGFGYASALKAWGAEPSISQRCVTMSGIPCPTATHRDKRAARKWRQHKIHHSRGFNPQQVFAQPRAARRIFVRKIARVLKRSHRPLTRPMVQRDGPCSDRCYAFKVYAQMMKETGCADRGKTYPLDPGTCRYPDGTRPITKEEVQRTGAVVLCGGAVAIGVGASPFSGGTTAFIAGWGATSCLWSFWSAFD